MFLWTNKWLVLTYAPRINQDIHNGSTHYKEQKSSVAFGPRVGGGGERGDGKYTVTFFNHRLACVAGGIVSARLKFWRAEPRSKKGSGDEAYFSRLRHQMSLD